MNQPGEPPNYPSRSDFPPASQPPQNTPPRAAVIQRSNTRPIATYTLIAVTAVVYALQLASNSMLGVDLPAAWGAKVNELIQAGQLWRLITPLFLHSTTNYLHILFNMYALYSLGRGLEAEYGHLRYLVLYFLSGFAGNVASFIMTPNPSYGASTAIFGFLGAEAVLVYQNRKMLRNFRSIMLNLLTIAAINLFLGLSNPGIDNWGHLGGLIGGTLFAWFAGPLWEIEGFASDLRLVDRRSINSILTSGVLVAAIIAAAAVFTITTRAR